MNTIQIKQSTVTSAPSSLLNGELAYSYLSGKLFIGTAASDNAIEIGGPGLLANYQTENDEITITGDATGIGKNAITLTLANTGIVAGTYTKITIDPKGRATFGDYLTAADIPTLTATKISDFDTQVRTNRLDQLAAPTAPVSFNNQRLTNLPDPLGPQDAATKAYVDAARAGLDVKQSVKVATTTNISLTSPGTTIDGVVLSAGNRVLVKNQTAPSENGIYIFNNATSVMTRATDADTNAEVTAGMFTFVEEGTTNGDSGWVLLTDDPIVLDNTGLTFGQFSGTGQIVAGLGLTKNGNTLDVGGTAGRIVVTADAVDLATVGTAGSYYQVTTDAYGRVTTGTNPAPITSLAALTAPTSPKLLVQETNGNVEQYAFVLGTGLESSGFSEANNTYSISLDSDLAAIASITTNGLIVKTGDGTATSRSVVGTTNRVTVVNEDGVTGNPTIDIAATYIGQNSITTLGIITTGVWQGSTVGMQYGGTGNTAFTATQIPYSDGSKFVSSADLNWNDSTKTLTVNGTISGATINGGSF